MAERKYEITSAQHPLVKHLVRLRDQRNYRYEKKCVLIEGIKLIAEVCQKQPAITILREQNTPLPSSVNAQEIITVSESVMRKISGVQQPEGLVAEVTMPASHSLEKMLRILALDGVSDPGNLGTLMRTALALGWEGILLLEGCCDPFNDKALRSAKGATFRLPLAQGNWQDVERLAKKNGMTSLVADLEGMSVNDLNLGKEGVLLVLGNEAHGPSSQSKTHCKPVKIPMVGPMESLNVAIAGGILMYLLKL